MTGLIWLLGLLEVSPMAAGLEMISDPPYGKESESDWPIIVLGYPKGFQN